MQRKQIITISIIGIIVILFLGIVYFVKENSGVNPPFTVVESQSMQHNDSQSEIGIIDTGDMIYVQSPDNCDIITYVEGYKTGYKSFGDYGSVIVYKRDTGNPVIHRAIVYVEKNGSSWDIESLKDYDTSLWIINGDTEHHYIGVSGTLYMTFKSDYRDYTISVNLDSLTQSGYLTLGDNNSDFDQNTGVMHGRPISRDMIKSVAQVEIPWLGCLKLMMNGKEDRIDAHASNSIEYLEISFVTIILIVISISYIFDELMVYRISRRI